MTSQPYIAQGNGTQKALLDNGCYVVRVPDETLRSNGALQFCPAISASDGAKQISQYLAKIAGGESNVMRYPGSDVVLFVANGSGSVRIGKQEFPVASETGVCIKPGEAFQIASNETLSLTISVCPQCESWETLETMPATFDSAVPGRVQGVDPAKREAMGDRFFQVLIDRNSHGTPVTQFIGEIPESRAPHHHHPYEETITILSGEGTMWTDDRSAPVQPGDTIFLPPRQSHSLECSSADGMRLIGLFYPSMSPATSY